MDKLQVLFSSFADPFDFIAQLRFDEANYALALKILQEMKESAMTHGKTDPDNLYKTYKILTWMAIFRRLNNQKDAEMLCWNEAEQILGMGWAKLYPKEILLWTGIYEFYRENYQLSIDKLSSGMKLGTSTEERVLLR